MLCVLKPSMIEYDWLKKLPLKLGQQGLKGHDLWVVPKICGCQHLWYNFRVPAYQIHQNKTGHHFWMHCEVFWDIIGQYCWKYASYMYNKYTKVGKYVKMTYRNRTYVASSFLITGVDIWLTVTVCGICQVRHCSNKKLSKSDRPAR